MLWREQTDRRRRREFERRAQARRVSIGVPTTSVTPGYFDSEFIDTAVRLTITNGSDEAISNCRARYLTKITAADGALLPDEIGTIPAGRLLPGQASDFSHGFNLPTPLRPDILGGAMAFLISTAELRFTDAAGIRWHRDAEHTLREVKGADPW